MCSALRLSRRWIAAVLSKGNVTLRCRRTPQFGNGALRTALLTLVLSILTAGCGYNTAGHAGGGGAKLEAQIKIELDPKLEAQSPTKRQSRPPQPARVERIAETGRGTERDGLPPQLIEFFRDRDRWLMAKTLAEMPPFNPSGAPGTPVQDELKRLDDEVAENLKLLAPVESRIFQNTLKNNKQLKGVIEKDKARAQEYKDAIADAQKRIKELGPELVAEQKAVRTWQEQRQLSEAAYQADCRERAKTQVLGLRQDMTLMPPNSPRLDPGNIKMGSIGVPPQWPLGIDDLNGVQRANIVQAADQLSRGEQPNPFALRFLERMPGGVAAAKTRHNLHVVQVFDSKRLLVSFIGGEQFDWPIVLLEVGDTSQYADGATLRVTPPLYVAGVCEYEAINGAARTKFVLKPFDIRDLPPYVDQEISMVPGSFRVSPPPQIATNERARLEKELEGHEAKLTALRADLEQANAEIKKTESKLARMKRADKQDVKPKVQRAIEEASDDVDKAHARAESIKNEIHSEEAAIQAALREMTQP
jgi:hypothetical protein